MELETSIVKFWKVVFIQGSGANMVIGTAVLRTLEWKSFRRIEALNHLIEKIVRGDNINIIDFDEIDEEAYMYFNEHSLNHYKKEEKDDFNTNIISHYHYLSYKFV